MIEQPGRGLDPLSQREPAHGAPLAEAGSAELAPGPVSAEVAAAAREEAPKAQPEQQSSVLAQLALALGTLAAVGASLGLAAQQLLLQPVALQRYLTSNQLAPSDRTAVLITMGLGAAVFAAPAALAMARWRLAALPVVSRVARILCPLALAWTVPSLLAYYLWYEQPLPYLIYLSAVVLATERLFRLSIAALPARARDRTRLSPRVARALAFGIVALAAAAFAGYIGFYSHMSHKRLMTSGYDLGIFDNLIYNNLHGRFFRSPVLAPNLSYLSNHAEFGTIVFAPLYAIKPGAATLLWGQALFTGAGAIFLYLFAATQLPRWTAVVVALGYLLYAPLHGAVFYDFHWMPMTVPLWFGLFYALAIRKKWLIALFVCLLIPMREEVGVMLAVLGVFLAASGYWFRLGMTLAAVGASWFALAKFVIMPMAGTWWFANMYADLISPGEDGYGSVVKTLLVNPNYVWKTLATEGKLVFFLHLAAPVVFLPFRKPLLAFLALPGFFFTLLTTSYPHTISIRFQYTTHWVPWIFAASVIMLMLLGKLGRPRQTAAVCALALGIFAHSYVYGAILQRNTFIGGFQKVAWEMSPQEKERYAKLQALIQQIPRKASVSATETECPHISNRIDAYTMRVSHGDADFLLVRYGGLGGDEKKNFVAVLTKHAYGLLDSGHDLYLFKKGHESPQTRDALRRLGVSLPADAKTRTTFH